MDEHNCSNCFLIAGMTNWTNRRLDSSRASQLNHCNITGVFATKGRVKWSVRNYRPHHGCGKSSPIITSSSRGLQDLVALTGHRFVLAPGRWRQGEFSQDEAPQTWVWFFFPLTFERQISLNRWRLLQSKIPQAGFLEPKEVDLVSNLLFYSQFTFSRLLSRKESMHIEKSEIRDPTCNVHTHVRMCLSAVR